MKRSLKIASTLLTALGIGFAAAPAHSHPGWMGGDAQGMHGPMGYGPYGPMGGTQLLTPEERSALAEKMRNASTPDERHKIMDEARAEVQKRAKEQGITLPERFGPRFGGDAQRGMWGPMGHGPMAGMQLLTPEERTALADKMHNAKTPDERRKIMDEARAEVQKRAKEQGITLSERFGPHGFGSRFGRGADTQTR